MERDEEESSRPYYHLLTARAKIVGAGHHDASSKTGHRRRAHAPSKYTTEAVRQGKHPREVRIARELGRRPRDPGLSPPSP